MSDEWGEFRVRGAKLAVEREQLARLHEVATERTVQLAAVIEQARTHDPFEHECGGMAPCIRDILAAVDTGAALREVRAKAWDEGAQYVLDMYDFEPYRDKNPYREGK